MTTVVAATEKAADDIAVLRRRLSLLHSDADHWGYAIDSLTNSVNQTRETPASLGEELLGDIQRLLQDAAQIDSALVRALSRMGTADATGNFQPDVEAILAGRTAPPADPEPFNTWWKTLSAPEKDALWEHDQYLGNHAGMPVVDRDHYNRRKLADELSRAPQNADLRGINDQLRQPARYLLTLDSQTGQRPHAAIATGNPDTAKFVATFVPGTGARPSNLGEGMDRAESMRYATNSSANTSVISWFDYDAPQDLVKEAPHRAFADDAAAPLDEFQSGLRASHEGSRSINTVIGHSYGTTVIGDAASGAHHLDADQVIFVASPGVTVDHASDLHLTGQSAATVAKSVYSTTAAHDPISLYPLAHRAPEIPFTDDFGIDPTSAAFGGVTFTSDPGAATTIAGRETFNPDAHSQYWDRGNVALTNMGSIIAPQTD